MKQLLFSASLALCFIGCGRSTEKTIAAESDQHPKVEPMSKTSKTSKTGAMHPDSNKTSATRTSTHNQPIKKSGESKPVGNIEPSDKSEKRVIKHGSPTQSKIDSIKPGKQKLKK